MTRAILTKVLSPTSRAVIGVSCDGIRREYASTEIFDMLADQPDCGDIWSGLAVHRQAAKMFMRDVAPLYNVDTFVSAMIDNDGNACHICISGV